MRRSRDRQFLQRDQLADALSRQAHELIEGFLIERRRLRRALNFDNTAIAGHDEVRVRIYDNSGNLVAGHVADEVDNATDPQIAATTGGYFVVTWTDAVQGGNVRFRVYNNDGTPKEGFTPGSMPTERTYAVNLRLIDDLDWSGIAVEKVDGRNSW